MTLYDLLVNEMSTQMELAVNNFRNDKEFYKSVGRFRMCEELIKMLSDDILKMEVTTRYEVLKKGE